MVSLYQSLEEGRWSQVVLRTGETESYFQSWLACVLINLWRTHCGWTGWNLGCKCPVSWSPLWWHHQNIPLAHKEPCLANSHPSIVKSRRDASRSEKAVHGELCITPSNELSLHRHEDSGNTMLLRKKKRKEKKTEFNDTIDLFKGTHI